MLHCNFLALAGILPLQLHMWPMGMIYRTRMQRRNIYKDGYDVKHKLSRRFFIFVNKKEKNFPIVCSICTHLKKGF